MYIAISIENIATHFFKISTLTLVEYLVPINTPIVWNKILIIKNKNMLFSFRAWSIYPIQAGKAINIESNKLTAMAILIDIPKLTKIGITSIGPPAPDNEHIVPVIIPKNIIKSLLLSNLLSPLLFSLFFLISMDKPEQRTTKYKNSLAVS